MILNKNINLLPILFYTWRSLIYFLLLSVSVYVLHHHLELKTLTIPFESVALLSTALAIFLGFKNNSAYDRWWEARKIWGLLVNYSRAWGREVVTLSISQDNTDHKELCQWQKRVVYRHIAFLHALRVFLRQRHAYNEIGEEWVVTSNDYNDIRDFVSPEEATEVLSKLNPPNYLLMIQGRELQYAYERGWLSDYRFVRLDETLIEFNNHQGMSERIKNTPFPRPHSFFSRVFVYLHGTLVPFAFVETLGLYNIPLALIINFVFLSLDLIGEYTEDPFENRPVDTPISSICVTIEQNLKEMLDEIDLPQKLEPIKGVLF